MIKWRPTGHLAGVTALASTTVGSRSVDVRERMAPPRERMQTMEVEAQSRFRAMVESEFDFVWRSLRALGVPDGGVDDAAQHVFLVAARRFADIQAGSERAFLFATARGVAANARRARARSREASDDQALERTLDDRPDPEEALTAQRGREMLDAILASFPEELRTVFLLFELEGMTAASIAELLGIPPGTVASRLRRAREDFRTAVRELGVERGEQDDE